MIERVMTVVVHAVGHPAMLPLALLGVGLLYGVAGVEITNFSLSVFTMALIPILQHSQNRDGAAIQAKLDEIIRASDARNDFIGIDRADEKTIEGLRCE